MVESALMNDLVSYYPANNQTAITLITNAASGSGQIAKFDTTQLSNGAYFA